MALNLENISGVKVRSRKAAEAAEAPFLFMCASTLLMAAVNVHIFGTSWAVLIVSLCIGILYLGRVGLPTRLMREPILVMLPGFYVLSTIWSDERTISLSYGLQTLLTVLAAVTIAQCTSRRQFLLIIFLATSAVCMGCLVQGGMGPSASGPVLTGFLGSKDAMGLFAYSGAMASLAMMFDRERGAAIRACAFIIGLIEVWIAISVHATTAAIALGLGVTLFLGGHLILSRFKSARWASYLLFFLIMMALVGLSSEIVEFFMSTANNQLGKDVTLTGRTVLWEKAIDLFTDSPLVGHGYRAFWLGSSVDARQLLQKMGQTDGRGFHFHEQYLEVLADTGIAGGIILLATFAKFLIKIWRNAVTSPSNFTAYSLAVMIVYIVRWMFETAFLPFSFDMMMLYGLGAAAMSRSNFKVNNKKNANVSSKHSLKPDPNRPPKLQDRWRAGG